MYSFIVQIAQIQHRKGGSNKSCSLYFQVIGIFHSRVCYHLVLLVGILDAVLDGIVDITDSPDRILRYTKSWWWWYRPTCEKRYHFFWVVVSCFFLFNLLYICLCDWRFVKQSISHTTYIQLIFWHYLEFKWFQNMYRPVYIWKQSEKDRVSEKENWE